MRADELHKFSDGTLDDVRSALNDIAKGISMEYLPKRKWSSLDKRRARVMVQDIDKKLFERRSKSENKGIVPTEMELVLEQPQQVKMEILLEPTSNKLLVGDLCDSVRIKLVTTGKKRWSILTDSKEYIKMDVEITSILQKESKLIYDKEEGIFMFEKNDERITFKMPHKMEKFKDIEDLNTDNIPPFFVTSKWDNEKGEGYVSRKRMTRYSKYLKLGPEYKRDEGVIKIINFSMEEVVVRVEKGSRKESDFESSYKTR
ncbi:hypothetical protein Tco_1092757 [Tanacetum coccineum]|uniref:Uncharacterized protein n=1 Tax=Tanacetum coccineum TaxID=301880 RepID=A0ABQ5IAR6_9ASTR